jgi:hypothetical protein
MAQLKCAGIPEQCFGCLPEAGTASGQLGAGSELLSAERLYSCCFGPAQAPNSGKGPPPPDVRWACGCLAELSGKCGASRSLWLGKRARGAGWRLGWALLYPPPKSIV